MKNISKLLVSSTIIIAMSSIVNPLIADETEEFTFSIDTNSNNDLVLTNNITGGLLSGSGQNYNIIGDMSFVGNNIIENQTCNISFKSLNSSDGYNFKMKNTDPNSTGKKSTSYIFSFYISKNGVSDNDRFNVQSVNHTIGTTADGAGKCTLVMENMAIELKSQLHNLNGIYEDTITVTATVNEGV